MNRKTPVFIFIAGSLFWMILYVFIAPQHAGTDFFIFKNAGANMALGAGFMEVTTPDNQTLTPKLYSAYPPLYPFLYGLYTMIAGFGAYENTYFNLLLKILWSGALLWLFIKSFSDQLSASHKQLLALCSALLIPVSATLDRPDDLTLLLIFLSFLSLQSNSPHKLLFTFFFVGANFVTAPFGGLLNLLSVVILLVYKIRFGSPENQAFTKRHIVDVIAGGLAIPSVWIVVYLFQDPDAFTRLFVHGTQKGGISTFLGFLSTGDASYYIKSFGHIANVGLFYGLTFAAGFAISHLVPVIFFTIRFVQTRQILQLFFGGIFGALFIGTIILFPFQFYYMFQLSIVSTALFLIFCLSENHGRFAIVPLSVLAIITVLYQPRTIRDVYTRIRLRESYNEAMQEAKNLSTMISGKWVGINSLQQFTVKPYANVGWQIWCETPEKYDFVAVSYRDLKTGELAYPAWFDEKKYDLVYKPDISPYAPKTKLDEIMLRSSDIWQFALYKKRQ